MAEITINGTMNVSNGNVKINAMDIANKIGQNNKVIDAMLTVSVSGGADIKVYADYLGGENQLIDIATIENGKASVNITEEIADVIKTSAKQIELRFVGATTVGRTYELNIKYTPERIMHENSAYFNVDAGKAGHGKVNLATGNLHFAHTDSAASGVRHVYNSWQASKNNYSCGKGWKLNLQQSLIRNIKIAGQDVYTYIDGDGNCHEFAERFYYKSGGRKVYVAKNNVSVGLDGKLTYGTHEIKTELKTTSGLTLQTDLKGFNGWEKLELQSDERAQLESEIEQLEDAIEDLIQTQYADASKDELEGIIAAEKSVEDINIAYRNMVKLDIIPNIDGTSFEENKNGFDYREAMLIKQGELYRETEKAWREDISGYTGEASDKEDKYSDTTKRFTYINNANGANYIKQSGQNEARQNDATVKSDDVGENKANLLHHNFDNACYYRNTFEDKCAEIQQAAQQNGFRYELIAFYGQMASSEAQKKLKELNDSYLENHDVKDRRLTLYSRAQRTLEEYRKLKLNKKSQWEQLIAQEPVKFLTDNSGNILGFNDSGALVAIADTYENVTYINYEDGKLISATDTDGNETKFEYENALLDRIIDMDEKVTRFEYINGLLSKIIYPNGTSSKYFYDTSDFLVRTEEHDGYGVRFIYDSKKAVTDVKEFTSIGEINSESVQHELTELERPLAHISYRYMSTTVTDRLSNNKTYIFDNMGRPVTVYEGDYYVPGEDTKSIALEYKGGQKSFSIADNMLYKNILSAKGETENITLSETGIRQKVYVLQCADLPEGTTEFVFSAWAKANAVSLRARRKFELKAEVMYTDNTQETFSASYDWLNTDWQYLALPVSVEEADTVGDRLPAKFPFKLGSAGRTFESVTLILDYTGNTGAVEFDCVTFRQGNWTYAEFDENEKQLLSEDDKGNVTEYEYDKDDRMVKSILTDRLRQKHISAFEYNKQGKLVRSTDYNGLCEETIYDDKGRAVKAMTYNVADPTSKFYNESVIDEKGRVTADIDIAGKFNSAEYELDRFGDVSVSTDAMGGKTAFGYKDGELVSVSGDVDGDENKNTIHRTAGFVTEVASGGTKYNYTYDGFGRKKSVSVNDAEYLNVDYKDDKTTTVNYANGHSFTTVTDTNGKVKNVRYNEAVVVENTYDDNGILTKSCDKTFGIEYNTNYTYYGDGKVDTITADGFKQDFDYEDDAVKKVTYTVNGNDNAIVYEYEYDTDPSKKLTAIILPNGEKQSVTHDGLGRVTCTKTGEFERNIYYKKYGDHATNYVGSVWYNNTDNTRYEYDKKGNIISIKENNKTVAQYEYDSLNRLTRDNDVKVIYNNNGNILEKGGKKYTYDGNRLISYNGQTVGDYDGLGNPHIYRDKILRWEKGRLLTGYDYDNDKAAYKVTFTYNASGMRTSKTANGIKTDYYLDGDKIICEARGANSLYYYYGIDGLAGFSLNGVEYVYRKNIQGDVTHIYAKGGTMPLVKYDYAAWGEQTIYAETGYENLAQANPFRYRGYYYDAETNLYYLNSRYYDAQTGRFLNADNIDYLEPETLNGLNLYAYCGNNPVMNVDPSGHAWWHWLLGALAVVGAIALTVVTMGAAAVVLGASAAVTAGVMAGAAVGGVIGATYGAISAYNSGATSWQILGSAVLGGIAGGIAGGVLGATLSVALSGVAVGGGLAIAGGGALGGAVALSSTAVATAAGVIVGVLGVGISFMKNPDPYARPGQKKQGLERKNKAREKDNFQQRNGRRDGPQPLPKHTPGRVHKKYSLLGGLDSLLDVIYEFLLG